MQRLRPSSSRQKKAYSWPLKILNTQRHRRRRAMKLAQAAVVQMYPCSVVTRRASLVLQPRLAVTPICSGGAAGVVQDVGNPMYHSNTRVALLLPCRHSVRRAARVHCCTAYSRVEDRNAAGDVMHPEPTTWGCPGLAKGGVKRDNPGTGACDRLGCTLLRSA